MAKHGFAITLMLLSIGLGTGRAGDGAIPGVMDIDDLPNFPIAPSAIAPSQDKEKAPSAPIPSGLVQVSHVKETAPEAAMSPALAVQEPTPAAPTAAPPTTIGSGANSGWEETATDSGGQFWLRAEYLLWWTKNGTFPPLVTTAPSGTPLATAGLLGEPTTTVLFPNGDSDNPRSGGRFTGGLWLDRERKVGFFGRYFFLATQTNNFAASSDDTEILMIPFFDPVTGTQRRFVTAFPNAATGALDIRTSNRFYGGDLDLMCNLCCGCNYRLDGLLGWRIAQLNDDYRLLDSETNIFGSAVKASDDFGTRNQFNGVDLGLLGDYRHGRWSVDVLAKIALGVNNQNVNIAGSSFINGVPFSGGLFALASNSGSHSRSVFAVMPELNLNLGYQVTSRVRLLTGYSIIYLSNVVRAGNQIDTTINPTFLPPSTPSGAARPSFTFRDTDFWAQGLNFGMEVRW